MITAISLDTTGVESHEYEYIEKYSRSVVETNLAAIEDDLVTTECPAYRKSVIETNVAANKDDMVTNPCPAYVPSSDEDRYVDADYLTINKF